MQLHAVRNPLRQGGTDYLFIVDVAFYKIYQPVNLSKILTLSGRKIINNSNMVAKFDEMVSQIEPIKPAPPVMTTVCAFNRIPRNL